MERSPPDGPLNASGALAGEAAGGARGFSAAWTAVLAALMALLIVATVLGNALVMLAFVADSSLRTQNNFFLLNLAISDFLVGKAPQALPEPGAPTGPASGDWSADLGCLLLGHTPRQGAWPGEEAPVGAGEVLCLPGHGPGTGEGCPRKGAQAGGRSARRKAQRLRVQRWLLRCSQTKAAGTQDAQRALGGGLGEGRWGGF